MGTLFTAPKARRLAAAAAAAAALLVGTEAGLRVAKFGAPIWHHPDLSLGWSLRPYAHGHEGTLFVRLNAEGEHDVHHYVDKRKGVYRIAVLGDAYSEAIGLPLRSTWWWQLPVELDRCGFATGKKIEVLNFSVAGYSTAQQAIVLESKAMRYRPDLVLVQLSQGDAVRENSLALATRRDRPFFRLEDGELRLDQSFVDLRDFERRSQFRYEVAREVVDVSRLLQLLHKANPMRKAFADSAIVPDAALQPPRDARWQDAWQVTEALLARMRDYAARNGARLAIVAVRHPLEREGELGYAEARLSAFGAREGMPVVAVAGAQRATAEGAAAALCRAFSPAASPKRIGGAPDSAAPISGARPR